MIGLGRPAWVDLELILHWVAMLIEVVQQHRQLHSNVSSRRAPSVTFLLRQFAHPFGYFFSEAIRSVSKACYLEPIFYKYEYKPLIIYMFVSAGVYFITVESRQADSVEKKQARAEGDMKRNSQSILTVPALVVFAIQAASVSDARVTEFKLL